MTSDGKTHAIYIQDGNAVIFRFPKLTMVSRLRMVFDLDYTRSSVSPFVSLEKYAMRCHIGKDFKSVSMPENLAKEFSVETNDGTEWREIVHVADNRKDLVILPIEKEIMGIRIVFVHSWGSGTTNLFACGVR